MGLEEEPLGGSRYGEGLGRDPLISPNYLFLGFGNFNDGLALRMC